MLGCGTREGCTQEAGKVGAEAGVGVGAVVATAGVAWGTSSLGLSISSLSPPLYGK
jgi:hypothetical protein